MKLHLFQFFTEISDISVILGGEMISFFKTYLKRIEQVYPGFMFDQSHHTHRKML